MPLERLPDLELAAFLCSRICHDVVSPVGAVVNGLEMLDDEPDGQARDVVMNLVRQSAASASARLQFLRLAFGASGSAEGAVDLGQTRSIVSDFMAGGKVELDWLVPAGFIEKSRAKLLLNLLLIALQALPRGEALSVSLEGDLSTPCFILRAQGSHLRVPEESIRLLSGDGGVQFDSRNIQAYYTARLLENCGFSFNFGVSGDVFTLSSSPSLSANPSSFV